VEEGVIMFYFRSERAPLSFVEQLSVDYATVTLTLVHLPELADNWVRRRWFGGGATENREITRVAVVQAFFDHLGEFSRN
jgi:hypothetical protein